MENTLPVVTLIRHDEGAPALGVSETYRFRLEGGTIAPGQEPRTGLAAWCEITLHGHGRAAEGWYLASYGGEVWPAAWPALFEGGRGSASTGPWTRTTAVGLRLLEQAAGIRTDRLSRAMSALAVAERALFESLADPLTLGSDCGPLIAGSAAATLRAQLLGLGFVDVSDVLEAAEARTSARWVHFHAEGVSFEEQRS